MRSGVPPGRPAAGRRARPGRLRRVGAAAGWLVVAGLLSPPAVAASGRWHFVIEGAPRLTYSLLFSRSAEGDETRLLLEARAGRFVLVSRQPADRTETFESVAEAGGKSAGESLSRRLVYGAVPGVAACSEVSPPDACVLLEGARGRLSARLSAFGGDGAGALAARARQLVSPSFLERLRALAEVFPLTPELDAYGEDFLALVDPAAFRLPRALRRGERRPGCDFQASFGFPCSEAERRRDEALARPRR